MTVGDLDRFFRPRGVALIAEGDGALIRAVAANLAAGSVPVVRLGIEEVDSDDAQPLPDLAVVVAATARVPALIARLAGRGVRAVILPGDHLEDTELAPAIAEAARAAGVRLLGPAGTGVAAPGRGLFAGAFARCPGPGRVALVAQSGSLAGAVIDWARRREVGFSHVAVLGDMLDLGFAEVLDHLAQQSDCQAALLVMEDVTEARRFLSAARALARSRPVIVLRTGRGVADAVFEAAFARVGLLRVATLEELFDALATLAVGAPIRRERLAVIANGRGIGRLACDALVAAGGRAATPALVDVGEAADGPAYAEALARLGGDPAVDAVLSVHAPTALAVADEVAAALIEAKRRVRAPVLTTWLGEPCGPALVAGLARINVPVFDTPERAIAAFLHILAFRRAQELVAETPPSVPDDFVPELAAAREIIARIRGAGGRDPGDAALSGLLAAYGLASAPEGASTRGGLAIRLRVDPRFGPVLFLDGTVAALPPLNMKLAADALARLAPAVTAGLAGVELALVKLAQLALDLEEVEDLALRLGPDLDGNPAVFAASLRLTEAGTRRRPCAIRPYPRALEAPLALADGRRWLVRPVAPEDEPALKELFARLTPEEARLRFFAPKATLTHATAARLSQIDYDREMALVVAERGAPGRVAVHGIVHLIADSDHQRAEFAIMVAHDATALGLGPVLMRRILDHAAAVGVTEVFGEVLAENRAMLRLCEVLGFRRHMAPDDPGVIHVAYTPPPRAR